jgi:hypothetical protein
VTQTWHLENTCWIVDTVALDGVRVLETKYVGHKPVVHKPIIYKLVGYKSVGHKHVVNGRSPRTEVM